jgi:hypothetical protein
MPSLKVGTKSGKVVLVEENFNSIQDIYAALISNNSSLYQERIRLTTGSQFFFFNLRKGPITGN